MKSMPPSFWSDLPEIINEIDQEALARVIVISSTGKHFSAGMDLSVFSNADSQQKKEKSSTDSGRQKGSFYRNLLKLQETFNCIDNSRIPVLMAIQGGCIGGAVDFASACDMRYCTEDAFFCIQEINIGMTADVGTFPRLPHLLPLGLVKELAFTGRRLFSKEAKEIGLVNNIFSSHEEMIKEVMLIAKEITKKSPLAIWGSKEAINYTRGRTIEEGLNQIALWQSGMYNPKVDMMEALSSQLENKEPEFQDLYPLKKDYGL
jgi:enoyl-CoA hydratase